METMTTTASLVPAGQFASEADALMTTVTRAEVEEALSAPEPPELFLELLRNGDERFEVSIAWEREDLERLLGDGDGSEITLMFERDRLEQAIDEDVAAHGLRERALVLTVAAATAATAATSVSTAAAAPDPGTGASANAALVSTGGHDEAGLTARGITPSGAHDEATLAARGIDSQAVASVHDEATPAARGVPSGAHDEATLAARGIDPQAVSSVHDEATLVDRGIVAPAAAVHDEASLASRGIESQPTPAGDSGGIDVPSLDASTAAVAGLAVGGAALLIVAAGFATRRTSYRPA